METAHPSKFPEAVEKVIGEKIEIPLSVQNIIKKEKQSFLMTVDYAQLKDFLLKN